jgi:hypothetical protein
MQAPPGSRDVTESLKRHQNNGSPQQRQLCGLFVSLAIPMTPHAVRCLSHLQRDCHCTYDFRIGFGGQSVRGSLRTKV